MQYDERTVTANDGTSLFVRRYSASATPAAGNMLIVHGFGEHGARHDHVARDFASRGWNVVVPDLRGHGRTGGPPAHFRSFDEFTRDLLAIMRALDCDQSSTVVFAHSMGGLVAIRFLQTSGFAPQAVVLSSPLLRMKVEVPRITRWLGRVMSVVMPRCRFHSRIDPAHTTRSANVIERRKSDPLMRRFITACSFFAMLRAIDNAWTDAGRLSLPVLLLPAGDDRIVDGTAAVEWLATTASGDRECIELPEHYHEVFNDPGWEQLVGRVDTWLKSREQVS